MGFKFHQVKGHAHFKGDDKENAKWWGHLNIFLGTTRPEKFNQMKDS